MKQIIKQKEEFRPRRQDDADGGNSNGQNLLVSIRILLRSISMTNGNS